MKNLIEYLPENINITVTKEDLLEFADHLLSKVVSRKNEIKPSKSIFNVDEAADFLSISKSAIYKYTHEGKIPHY
ncbi:MAG: helix-turn-helix domain-containing protein, partial [Bacteroidales bacterium]|nr:helix-turn-helix domain-containing protein [Bacteroidales bacterium]